ncbi:MAG: hypothetical protein AAF696_19845 [Bacteroidota bacterium]
MQKKPFLPSICIFLLFISSLFACKNSYRALKYQEEQGFVKVEAESFTRQELDSARHWYVIKDEASQLPQADADPIHLEGASGGSYLEILPDTRKTHDDPLVPGVSFSNKAGQMAILSYRIKFQSPGKYYVWVRAFSTGSEDNGIHVGLDGEWPASGQRMQWCQGKHQWTWESKQRTAAKHCGEPEKIFLMVEKAGWHEVQFSMREDGFEFDAFVLNQKYEKPE